MLDRLEKGLLMKINPDLIIKSIEKNQRKPPVDPAEKTNRSREADTVAFLKALQQVQGMENAMSVDTDRQSRIDDVKERIENGSYAPDSKKVAISLLKYIVKGTAGSR